MPNNKKNIKSRRPSSSRSKKRGGRGGGFMHNVAAWLLGGVLVVGLYVFVVNKFFVDPFSFRWRGIFGTPESPDGYEVRGIDISHYQQNIDWELLRNAKVNGRPLRFVIIKATEGQKLMDEDFNNSFYQAKQNDLIRGAYHFYRPSVDATKQAEFYLKQVHLEPGDLPPILDIEERGNKPLNLFQDDVQTWLDIVQTVYGVAPIIYTGYKFKVDYLNMPQFEQYPFWIAHYYVKNLAYQGQWYLWQYTDGGKVEGIRGKVDCNIFNGDMQQLQRFLIPDPSAELLAN